MERRLYPGPVLINEALRPDTREKREENTNTTQGNIITSQELLHEREAREESHNTHCVYEGEEEEEEREEEKQTTCEYVSS